MVKFRTVFVAVILASGKILMDMVTQSEAAPPWAVTQTKCGCKKAKNKFEY
ncbi:hypothetical protein CCACVL1_10408 [Corchorus capsularis]|uniref:Uncharacterized protein n=1 Tax=Corchorus capsularis TaxID=210143 RepID=A0A1R3IRA1_COCAP|nr:hypothetical protein CCACVL1_10408 [Corchorus capsularis]